MLNRRDFLKTAAMAVIGLFSLHSSIEDNLTSTESIPTNELLGLTVAHPYYIDDEDSARIVGCSSRKIMYTDDMGSTWILVNAPSTNSQITCVVAPSLDHWFVGTADGELWETVDTGQHWEPRSSVLFSSKTTFPEQSVAGNINV